MNKNYLREIYGQSLALLCDLYHLTMAYGYWKNRLMKREAVFHLFFRRKPFGGEYAVAAGLETAIEYIQNFKFDAGDLAYLEGLRSPDGKLLFEPGFLEYLAKFKFTCDIDAVAEGTPVFPYEPILRVQGPIIESQIMEAALLNVINFQTLIATKASRVCWAAAGDAVVEFGLRRAQGIDGAISASRAAYIGGCESTSNVMAGKLFGIPVKGTHAHSWIMAFDDEEESFRVYAEAMPKNCIFLVDTYDTINGVKRAIQVSKALEKSGVEMTGVRLDSGDLASLSIAARKLLDDAGFTQAKIMASNELDEHIIKDLKQQGAKIDIWGVGTHLVTGRDQPALDGVYKLSAVREPGGPWKHRLKLSEQIAKITTPGIMQIRRYYDNTGNIADMIYNVDGKINEKQIIIDHFDPIHSKEMEHSCAYQDLLVPIFRQGKLVYDSPRLSQMRQNCIDQLNRFSPTLRRFLNPQPYFVGLEKNLHEEKLVLVKGARNSRKRSNS